MKVFGTPGTDGDFITVIKEVYTDLTRALESGKPVYFAENEGADIYGSEYADEIEWKPYTGTFIVKENVAFVKGKYISVDDIFEDCEEGDKVEEWLDGKFIKDYFKPYD